MPEMTERQARDWPGAVAEVQDHAKGSTVPTDLIQWQVTWDEEVRPGRGRRLSATWLDGDYVAQILMDVYGYPTVAVAETLWLHNSADDECDCDHCTEFRKEEP